MSSSKWKNITQVRPISYKKVISWYAGLVKPKPQEAPFSHIVQIGDPTLRTISEEVPMDLIGSAEIRFLITKMRKVMKKYNCVGLSASQIGIPVRVILLEFSQKHMESHSAEERNIKEMEVLPFRVVINPEIKVTDYTKIIFSESCESVRGFNADVARYRGVELQGFDGDGERFKMQTVGWLARIVQHEMDHLNGKIYTDVMDRKSLACSCWAAINERGGKIELPYGAQ